MDKITKSQNKHLNPGRLTGSKLKSNELPRWLTVKESSCQCRRLRRCVFYLGHEDTLEKERATADSSILAWRMPPTEKPGGLPSMGSWRVGHDWAQFSSVAPSCLTLCDPMDCSTPGLPVPHHLPKSARVHVHCIGDAISCRILSYPLLLLLSIFPSIRVLSNESLFASGDQNTGASASVLPMSLQGCLPLRLTGLISLLSRGFSGVFSNTTLWRLQFFSALLS